MRRADPAKQSDEDLEVLGENVAKLTDSSARAERAEHELAHFFLESLDLLCVANLDGYFKRLNPAWTTTMGWSLEQLKARPFLEFVHPEDIEATTAQLVRLNEGDPAIFFENRYRHLDGSYRWLQWNARPAPEQRLIYATARDVTRRMRLEREVLEIVERERARLGRELHDGLCQNLAGIAALSSSLSRKLAANAESAASAAASEITGLLKDSIGQARDLARGLAPVGLDEAGLEGALETMALSVQHMFGVSCMAECDCSSLRIPPDVNAHLFRIAQEAVNNAVTHGRADRRGRRCLRRGYRRRWGR